jgi:glycosyltransferase involved in cell wall biosynthesis
MDVKYYMENWKTWLPWILGLVRWSMFFIFKVIPACCYRQKQYIPSTPENQAKPYYVTEEDVTVVVTCLEPPPSFRETVKHLIKNKPPKIIIVADVSCFEEVKSICSEYPEYHQGKIEVLSENKKGKREALVTGIKATRTKLVCLVDDDIQWCDEFLINLVAPFQHFEKVGGVGCKQMARVEGWCDIWNIMADMRLNIRLIENMATTALDKGTSCISGRTACYRTEIIQNDKFYQEFLNEYFSYCKCCGRHKLLSGDDKFITRFVINNGHKTYHQLKNNCKLDTGFEKGYRYLRQTLRWARNTWRSDLKAVTTCAFWKNCPCTAIVLLDKMISPFTMIAGLIILPLSAIWYERYILLLGWFCWLLFSRSIRLIYLIYEKPRYIFYIPIFVGFQYLVSLCRIWALCTLTNRGWGTRNVTFKGNDIVEKRSSKQEEEKKDPSPR